MPFHCGLFSGGFLFAWFGPWLLLVGVAFSDFFRGMGCFVFFYGLVQKVFRCSLYLCCR